MKIAVIGYSGAGKSTLAKALSELYRCPLLYLDTINFTLNWQERSEDEALSMVSQFMQNQSWIIDGNYVSLLQKERLEQADSIVFMNFPRWLCFKQAFSRYFKHRGKSRESVAEGCNEKFDLEFAIWILLEGRNKQRRAHYANIINNYKSKVTVLKSNAEVLEFLNKQSNIIAKLTK